MAELGALVSPREVLLQSSEEELIKACQAGKRFAQKRVYELFAGKMINVCRRYAKNKEQAQDFMHDGFIKVFLNMHKFRAQSSLETWITRIMINHSISAIKKEVRRGIKVTVEDAKLQNDSEEPVIENQYGISAQNVFDTMDDLPLGYRTVLSLFVLDGYSHKEIADQLGISEGTSKSQLAKAKRMLARMLKERYP